MSTPDALTAIWAKHDLAQLLTVYEDEIDRSGCSPFQEDREKWDGSGWHAFEIRDEILRRFKTLLDQVAEAERLRAALVTGFGALDQAADELERMASPVREWGGIARTPEDEDRLLVQRTGLRSVAEEFRAALTPPEPSGDAA